jgi:hypothetical protein
MTFQTRQGDVLVQRVPTRTPAGTLVFDQDPVILAYGEGTGHTHRVVALDRNSNERLAAQLFEEPDGRRLLLVERACVLTHDEHWPIALAPGLYSVTIQREYESDGQRNVVD